MTSESQPHRPRILLVDDMPDITTSQKWLLEHSGYEVFEAHSAAACLDLVDAYEFDLISLDLAMPNCSGIALCRRLRAHPRCKSTRMIAQTGIIDKKIMESAKSVGFDDYLVKPVAWPDLLQTLEALGFKGISA